MGETNDMVKMQLRHDITQRRQIHFICLKALRQLARERTGFLQQLALIFRRELEYFTDRSTVRHQNEPGIVAVIHQQQAGQREAAQEDAVFCQLWV